MNKEVVVTVDDLPPDVIQAVQKGQKIEAIKLLREATGLGLANAKVLVDRASLKYGRPKVYPSFADTNQVVPKILKSIAAVILLLAAYYFFVKA